MSSSGSFTSTNPSWRTAFLNSPGSPGSNFSYTTPVIPDGTYRVEVGPPTKRPDRASRVANDVTVTRSGERRPGGERHGLVQRERAAAFDARTSTDENPSALTYSWNFGTGQGSGSGPVPTKPYTAPGTFTVVLTVRDEWAVTATTTLTVTITEPAGNAAPVPTFTTNCLELFCGVTSAGTIDPNTGDVITYSWNWGDGTADHVRVLARATSYADTGHLHDHADGDRRLGQGSVRRRASVTMTEPLGNQPPIATFTPTCIGLTCQMNSSGTSDPEGNQIRYVWDFGDGTPTSTSAYPSHTYAVDGTYTITLTVTDGWNKVDAAHQVSDRHTLTGGWRRRSGLQEGPQHPGGLLVQLLPGDG